MDRLNAQKLEFGKTYRLGYNCMNCGEIMWKHAGWKDVPGIGGKLEKRPLGYIGLQGPDSLGDELCDAIYEFQGDIVSGSGAEPLWILEDGETCKDIPREIRNMGGAREGAGRKRGSEKRPVNVMLPPHLHARIKIQAMRRNMSLSAYIESVMERSVRRSESDD